MFLNSTHLQNPPLSVGDLNIYARMKKFPQIDSTQLGFCLGGGVGEKCLKMFIWVNHDSMTKKIMNTNFKFHFISFYFPPVYLELESTHSIP